MLDVAPLATMPLHPNLWSTDPEVLQDTIDTLALPDICLHPLEVDPLRHPVGEAHLAEGVLRDLITDKRLRSMTDTDETHQIERGHQRDRRTERRNGNRTKRREPV